MAERIPARLSAAEGRKFALTVGTAFLVLAGVAWWRGRETVLAVLATLGVALWIAGLTIPGRLSGVHRAWMGMAHAISKVTTPIFLGLVYFLAILPVGAMMRLFGRNPIRHRPQDGSYWARTDGPGNLTNQF